MSQSYVKNLSRPRLVQRPIGFASIRTGSTVPILIVPIPRSNQLLIPVDAILEFTPGVAYSVAPAIILRYSGTGLTVATFAAVNATASMQYADCRLAGAPTELIANIGRGFELALAADVTTGTGTILFTIVYRVKVQGG